MEGDTRPWGRYDVLSDEASHKVKRMTVEPGHRLSYQRHSRRSEHWFVVEGDALVTLDGVEHIVATGEAIDIPLGAAHRIENKGRSRSCSSRCSTALTSVRTTSRDSRTTTGGPPSQSVYRS